MSEDELRKERESERKRKIIKSSLQYSLSSRQKSSSAENLAATSHRTTAPIKQLKKPVSSFFEFQERKEKMKQKSSFDFTFKMNELGTGQPISARDLQYAIPFD